MSMEKIASASAGILDGDLAQGAVLGIHRRFPELLFIHLTETLVALYAYAVLIATTDAVDEGLTLLLGPAVLTLLASGTRGREEA